MPRRSAYPEPPEDDEMDEEMDEDAEDYYPSRLRQYRGRIFLGLAVVAGVLLYLGQPGNPLGTPRANISHRVLSVQALDSAHVKVALEWYNNGANTADISCTLWAVAFDGAGNAVGSGWATTGPSHSLLSGESNYDSAVVVVTHNQAYSVFSPANVRLTNCS